MISAIERKWIVDINSIQALGLEKCPKIIINQFYDKDKTRYHYQSFENVVTCFKTVNAGLGVTEEENETTISIEHFLKAYEESGAPERINKFRYGINLPTGELAGLDVFHPLKLVTVEIEFASEKEALDFVSIPDWFGKEITNDQEYDNYNLFVKVNQELNMFKYLSGYYEINEEDGICTSLLLTVKRNSYQHQDMARNFGYIPNFGGFAILDKPTPNEMFFGDSVSCQVKTSDKITPTLFDLIKNSNIYQLSTHKVKDVWLFLEKDFTPVPDEGIEYKKITMEEFHARVKELDADPYYF